MTHGATPHARTGKQGFTLLELSVVLTIIAIVTAMSVQTGIAVIATARQSATQKKMKAIDDALMAFRTANDRLPCPGDLTLAPGAADYGIEAGADSGSAIGIGTGVCTGTGMLPQANHTAAGATNAFATAAEGALPALTLGIPEDFMTDGWGNKFRYAVDMSMTIPGAFTSLGIGCTIGAVTVNDVVGSARSTGSAYALISHGPNGHGAYTRSGGIVNAGSTSVDELTNCHCNSSGVYNSAYAPAYVQKDPAYDSGQTGNALYYFDDLVSFKERWQMQTSWDVAGCQYVYVVDQANNRVEKFTTSGQYVSQFGSSGSGNGQLNTPFGIAIDSSGNIWVADGSNNRVEEFSSSGTFLASLGGTTSACSSCLCTGAGCPTHAGAGNGQFSDPVFVFIDTNNNILVSDFDNSRVEKFNSSGSYLSQFGSNGSGSGQFTAPGDLTIDSSGNIWVVDINNTRVEEFNSSGSYITQFGTTGTGNGQFKTPYGIGEIAISNGNLWVDDCQNQRLQEFNGSGSYLSQFDGSSYGTGNNQMECPIGLAVDSGGNIWVADYSANRAVKYNSMGNFQLGIGAGYNGVSGSVGAYGSGNGQFNIPYGIAIGSR